MSLSPAQRHAISREVSAGVPHTEIAQTYGISVARVLLHGNYRDAKGRVRRAAEPYQPLKAIDCTARPSAGRVGRGERCRAPGCEETVSRGSYCGHCAEGIYKPRAA